MGRPTGTHDLENAFKEYLISKGIATPKKCMRWAFGNDYRIKSKADMYGKWNGRHTKLGMLCDSVDLKLAFSFICAAYKAHEIRKVNKRMMKGLKKLDSMTLNKKGR